VSKENKAKQLRSAVRGELERQLEDIVPARILAWLAMGVTKTYSEIAQARKLIAAVGKLTEREEYKKLGDDLLALLSEEEQESIQNEVEVTKGLPTEEDEARSKAFLEEERRKVLEGK
jgi:hypothetical protein